MMSLDGAGRILTIILAGSTARIVTQTERMDPMLRVSEMDVGHAAGGGSAEPRFDADVVELPLLLPRWQVLALESRANTRGVTTAQMLRKVIAELLRESDETIVTTDVD
jgi:hypothetical protein